MPDGADVVRKRWPDATAFYAERDHRTALEIENFHAYVHRPVIVFVDPDADADLTTQRIALLVSNLTARWARNVTVSVRDVALASPLDKQGDKTLAGRIAREMRQADPFGFFEIHPYPARPDPGWIRLFVGPWTHSRIGPTADDYVVDASGWSALGNRGDSRRIDRWGPATAPAAALAAALGAGDLFKRAVGHAREEWLGTVNWCTWENRLLSEGAPSTVAPAIVEMADLGNLLIAGVGAIGSALLYVLGLMRLQGRVTVLDRDAVEASNLNRSPLFTVVDAVLNRQKTAVALALLRSLGIEGRAVNGTWKEHGERLSKAPFDAWVSLTNEDGAWAEVPFLLPPVVLHGTTTSGWGFAFGRHIPRLEDCTFCRLPRPHAEFRGPCAEGDVTAFPEREPARASLPFLSTAAAALVATELLKLPLPGAASLPNLVAADFRSGLPTVLGLTLGPTSDCGGCRMSALPLWAMRGGRGRFAALSSDAGLSR